MFAKHLWTANTCTFTNTGMCSAHVHTMTYCACSHSLKLRHVTSSSCQVTWWTIAKKMKLLQTLILHNHACTPITCYLFVKLIQLYVNFRNSPRMYLYGVGENLSDSHGLWSGKFFSLTNWGFVNAASFIARVLICFKTASCWISRHSALWVNKMAPDTPRAGFTPDKTDLKWNLFAISLVHWEDLSRLANCLFELHNLTEKYDVTRTVAVTRAGDVDLVLKGVHAGRRHFSILDPSFCKCCISVC